MTEEGLWVPHKRRRARIQQPRLRRECFGELVQIDGSGHDWFEGRGPRCTLLVFVDDATGNLLHLSFAKSESTHSYFRAVRAHLERYGKPVAYYTDKHSVFRATAREPRGGRTATQFGRALGDLNIDLLHADTPQAKGKVERANGVLQDRLVKELRLRNISDIDSANAYVREFAEKYNAKFGKEPKLNKDLHRPLLEVENLNDILAIQVERKVGHQLTINHDKRQILLEPNERSMEARGRTVVLYERENRAIEVRFNGSTLAQREMTERRSRNTGDVVAPRNLTQKLREIRRRQVWEEHRRHQERRAALAPRSAFEDRDVREEDSFSAELQ
jgi:hypothetical protein